MTTIYESVKITAYETYEQLGEKKRDKLGYVKIDSCFDHKDLDQLIKAVQNCYKYLSNPIILDVKTTPSGEEQI